MYSIDQFCNEFGVSIENMPDRYKNLQEPQKTRLIATMLGEPERSAFMYLYAAYEREDLEAVEAIKALIPESMATKKPIIAHVPFDDNIGGGGSVCTYSLE